MDRIGTYHVKPYSKYRRNIELIVHEGWKRHSFHELIEIDVTKGKILIKDYKEKSGEKISFTGWIMKCAAEALSEHKELNAYRTKRKVYYFDDVDIPIPVEREINGEMLPMVYILRKANIKSLSEISKEIREVQIQKTQDNKQLLGSEFTVLERFAFNAPLILKKLLVHIVRRRPFLKKKHMGTLAITSVGMKGNIPGWIIPMGGTTTIMMVVTSITKKPRVIKDEILIRDILHIVISVDHDIIDGGPFARFSERFVELCEEGFGIPTTE